MKLKELLLLIFVLFTFPAMFYLSLLRELWKEFEARRAVKKLAKSNKPKDRLIRTLVYMIFRV